MKSKAQQGLTLVELMVSMAIGLVVIGAVFVNYLNSSVGSRHTAAIAQVTDDASLALGILRNHIAMAGYSSPTGASSGGMTRKFGGIFILGCDGGFAVADKADPAEVTCVSPPSTAPDSILIRYEADKVNAPTVKNDAGIDMPADCIGTALTVDGSILDNRFQIDSTPAQLECQGNGGTLATDAELKVGKQPLIDNITDLQITYGMAAPDAGKPGNRVTRYVTASEVAVPIAGSTTWQDRWNNVISVRICMVVRSTNPVLDSAKPYRDCTNALQTPTGNDRRIYRAFTTTVTLNNRIDNSDPPP